MLAERRLQSQFRMLFTVTPEKPLAFILRGDLHTLYLLYKSRSLVIYREFYFRARIKPYLHSVSCADHHEDDTSEVDGMRLITCGAKYHRKTN